MPRRNLNFALVICALLFALSALLQAQQQQGPFRLRVVPSNASTPQGALRTYYIERTSITGKSNGVLNFGAQWNSSNPAVASIDLNTGMLTAHTQGTATITARSGPFRGSTQIRVTPIALIAIQVTAGGQANPTIPNPGTQQFTATGIYSFGPTQDLTATVQWTSSSPAVATITATGGNATAVAVGTTVISAALNGIRGSTSLNVGLSSIAISPLTATIAQTQLQPYTAIGTFSDASQHNVSNSVNWNSSNQPVALISTAGVASGMSPGSTNIHASSSAVSSNTVPLTVTAPPVLVTLQVAPSNSIITLGHNQGFTASAVFSDGSTKTLTNGVAWFTSNPAIAQVDSFGIATSISQGTVTITAIYSGHSGSAQLTINPPPTLSSITVTPANSVLGNGKTQQYTAIGHYNDSSNKDLTSLATWVSTNTAAAKITNAGIAGAIGIGSTNIQATYQSITGTTNLRTLGAPRFAYTVNQTQNLISEYAINAATGALQPLGYALTGPSPTDLAVDQFHNFAWVANSGLGAATFTTKNVTVGTTPRVLTVNTATNKVYVTNLGSHNVSVIDANNNIAATVAIPGGANLYSIAANSATNKIYVADAFQSKVFVINGSTDTITATISGFIGPIGLAVNTATNKIYVANQTTGGIGVINGATDTLATTVQHSGAGQAMGIDVNVATNKIYAANGNGVTVVDGVTDTEAAFVVDPDPHAINPIAVGVNPATNKIYVANTGDANTIFGSVTEIDGVSNSTRNIVDPNADGSSAIAVNPATNRIYVGNAYADQPSNRVRGVTVIDGATHNTTNLPNIYGSFATPITVNASTNTIYLTNFTNSGSTVEIINGATNGVTTLNTPGTASPFSVAVNPVTNTAYVANSGSGNVTVIGFSPNTPSNTISAYSVDPSFGLLTPAAIPAVSVGNAPTGVAVDPSAGRFLYVANSADNTVSGLTINPANGNLTPIGPATALGITSPFKIFIDPLGRFVYVAYGVGNSISAFTINQGTGVLTPTTPPTFTGGDNGTLTVDPSGRYLYSPSPSGNAVFGFAIDQTTGVLTPTTPPTFATGIHPLSVAIDPSGRFLYTCNTGDSTISIFAINSTDGTLTPANPPVIGPFGTPPVGMVIDPSGRFAIFGEQGRNLAFEATIDPNTGALSFLQEFHIRPAVGGVITGGAPLASVANFAYINNVFSSNISAFTVDPSSGNPAPVAGSPFATNGIDNNGQCTSNASNCKTGDSIVATDPGVHFAYLANYKTLDISAFSVNRSTGALAALPGSPFSINAPVGAVLRAGAMDPSGRFLWVAAGNQNNATSGPEALYGFSINPASGLLTPISGSPISLNPSNSAPKNLVFDPTGQFVYVSQNSNVFYGFKMDPATGALSPLAGSPFNVGNASSTGAVTIDPTGNFLYLPVQAGQMLVAGIDANSGALSPLSGSPFQVAPNAQQVVVDPLSRFGYLTASDDVTFVSTLTSYSLAMGIPSPLGQSFTVNGFLGVSIAPGTQLIYATQAFFPGLGTDQLQLYHADPSTGLLTLADALPTGGSGSLGPSLTGIYAAQAPHLLLVTLAIQNASVPQGVQQQLTATGVFSDGSTQDFTSSAIWTSSNPGILSVSPTGLALGVTQGTVSVTASVQGVSGSASIVVTGISLQSISITPASASLPQNSTLQFIATGNFSDGSTQDISQSVIWNSSNPGAVTISGSGLATAVASVGSSNISATSGALSSGTSAVSVHPAATLQSVSVSPPNPSLPLAASLQFSATAHYSDGSAPDVTDLATWASGTPSVASISNSAGTIGLATSVSSGTTAITATFNAVPSAASTLSVAKTLVSLAITPSSAFIALAHTRQFTATGTYSDGSTQDITNTVTWSSNPSSIVTITNTGLATGKGLGSATISATLTGVANSASVTGIF